jgi:hypothetical protein
MDTDVMRQHLDGVGFPAGKQDVLNWAAQHGASIEELDVMRGLPLDTFDSIDDVLNAADRAQAR